MPRPRVVSSAPAAAAAADPVARRRKAELALIHGGRKALGLDEDAYRDWLQQLTGKRSAADLDERGRQTVIEAMRKRGYAAATWGGLGGIVAKVVAGGGARPRPQHGKAIALWRALFHLGVVRDGSEAALDHWIAGKQGFGVAALRFADAKVGNMIIEGLKDWCAREGFVTQPGEPGIVSKRTLARAIWARLAALGAVRVASPDGLDAWLQGRVRPHKTGLGLLDARDLDRAIELLGEWLRKTKRAAQGSHGEERERDGAD